MPSNSSGEVSCKTVQALNKMDTLGINILPKIKCMALPVDLKKAT
jgi:hypothetical protein